MPWQVLEISVETVLMVREREREGEREGKQGGVEKNELTLQFGPPN